MIGHGRKSSTARIPVKKYFLYLASCIAIDSFLTKALAFELSQAHIRGFESIQENRAKEKRPKLHQRRWFLGPDMRLKSQQGGIYDAIH